jgi:hypothetical protein
MNHLKQSNMENENINEAESPNSTNAMLVAGV